MSKSISHLIPCSQPPEGDGLYYALCGAKVEGTAHSPTPDCPDCIRENAEDLRQLQLLGVDLTELLPGPVLRDQQVRRG